MRRILVVDDDLHTRLAVRAWLNQCGFRAAIAPNGLATLRRTRKGWRLRTCCD